MGAIKTTIAAFFIFGAYHTVFAAKVVKLLIDEQIAIIDVGKKSQLKKGSNVCLFNKKGNLVTCGPVVKITRNYSHILITPSHFVKVVKGLKAAIPKYPKTTIGQAYSSQRFDSLFGQSQTNRGVRGDYQMPAPYYPQNYVVPTYQTGSAYHQQQGPYNRYNYLNRSSPTQQSMKKGKSKARGNREFVQRKNIQNRNNKLIDRKTTKIVRIEKKIKDTGAKNERGYPFMRTDIKGGYIYSPSAPTTYNNLFINPSAGSLIVARSGAPSPVINFGGEITLPLSIFALSAGGRYRMRFNSIQSEYLTDMTETAFGAWGTVNILRIKVGKIWFTAGGGGDVDFSTLDVSVINGSGNPSFIGKASRTTLSLFGTGQIQFAIFRHLGICVGGKFFFPVTQLDSTPLSGNLVADQQIINASSGNPVLEIEEALGYEPSPFAYELNFSLSFIF